MPSRSMRQSGTDTKGLSRKEHVVSKLEAGEALNTEEYAWAIDLLNERELEELGLMPRA